nr:hypothetical protein [Tanacetum cinerariifolium]
MVVTGWQRGDDDDVGGVVVLMKTRRVAWGGDGLWCRSSGGGGWGTVGGNGCGSGGSGGAWGMRSDRSEGGEQFWFRRKSFPAAAAWWPAVGRVNKSVCVYLL